MKLYRNLLALDGIKIPFTYLIDNEICIDVQRRGGRYLCFLIEEERIF